MIKSNVCFFFPTPRGRNAMSLWCTDRQTASHWSALTRGMLSHVWIYVLCVLVFHCFFSLFILTFFPLLHSFQVLLFCYLKLTLMCAVTPSAAGGRNETHTCTHTEDSKLQAFAWYGICIYSLPLHHPPSPPHYLCILAHCIRPIVHCVCFHLCWGGVVVYYSWVVRSKARVIWQK